jgi:hypothetical protein
LSVRVAHLASVGAEVAGSRRTSRLAASTSLQEGLEELQEGLEEMFTVTRLGITGTPARTLTTSNPIESMISIARTTNRNVTHWRDGQTALRWTAAGMLNAQRSFRRVRGFKQMPPARGRPPPTRPPEHPAPG